MKLNYFNWIFSIMFWICITICVIIIFSGCCSQKCLVTKYVEKTDTLKVPTFITDSFTMQYVEDLQNQLRDSWGYMNSKDVREKTQKEEIKRLKEDLQLKNKEIENLKKINSKLKLNLEKCIKKEQNIEIKKNEAPVTININEANGDSSKIIAKQEQSIVSDNNKKSKSFNFFWLFVASTVLLIATNYKKIISLLK